MDGAHAQLQLITSKENLEKEKQLKISSNKQSTAHTVVEQPADTCPCFKLVKKDIKTMEVSHQIMNPIVMYLKKKLEELEATNVLKLRLHKKKAIMFALPNLPRATGQAFTIPNVRKGFIYTGQLDAATTSVPSFTNLLNTFRGNIEGTCLSDRKWLVENFFEEMYLYGTIKEATFDQFDVPVDVDSK